jgi:V/A-type H+-transporting ATPase subunit B
MRKGAGEGRTRADHLDIAAQLVSALARSRDVRDLADLIGAAALTETDRRYLALADAFNAVLINQGTDESRTLEETLERAWRVAGELPRRELAMVSTAELDSYYVAAGTADERDARTDDQVVQQAAPRSDPTRDEANHA